MTIHSDMRSGALKTEHKAEAILQAALELFAERGFHGTTVPEIADRARVGAGTIYRYFDSKEAIVNAVYQFQKYALATALMTDFPFEAPPRKQLEHFIKAALAFARQRPLAFRFLELHHHLPYLDKKSRAIEGLVIDPARAFFAAHREAKKTRDVPDGVLGGVVWGAIVGLVKAADAGYAELTPETEQQACDVLWSAIAAGSRP